MNKSTKFRENSKQILLYNPYLRVNGDYSLIWSNYTSLYNEDRPKREQLRTPHYDLFYLLVRLLAKQIEKDNKILRKDFEHPIDINEPYPFFTNTAYLARLRRYSAKKTIYNQLNRLEDAGLIMKKGHGSYRDFEVLINPDLLLIYDYLAPDYKPEMPEFSKTENQVIRKGERKSLPMYLYKTDVPLNKKIIAVDTVEEKATLLPSSETVNETDFHINRYPHKQIGGEQSTKSQSKKNAETGAEKEKSCAKKEKGKKWAGTHFSKEWWINMFVQQFYVLLITHLFSKHDIWEVEELRTKERIEEWFSGIKNPKQGVDWMTEAEWRIRAAARFYRSHNYDISNIYPDRYLSPDNEYGFKRTAQWWQKHKKNRLIKEQELKKHRENISKHLKLQEKVKEYAKSPDINTFRKCEAYVKVIIPDLMPQFLSCVQKINENGQADISLPVWKYKANQSKDKSCSVAG